MSESNIRAAKPRSALSTLFIVTIMLSFTAGCSVFGVESVEEAPYQLIQQDKQFEIRDYEPLVVAETLVIASHKEAGSKAFRKLFAYISGENEANTEISMTAPVISESSETITMTAPVTAEKEGEAWRYSFVLPKNYTLDNAPRPLNPDVSLAQIPQRRVATVRYSGRATDKAQSKNAAVLLEWIKSQGLESLSEPRWAGYNAPWTLPPFRRNEVLVDISSP